MTSMRSSPAIPCEHWRVGITTTRLRTHAPSTPSATGLRSKREFCWLLVAYTARLTGLNRHSGTRDRFGVRCELAAQGWVFVQFVLVASDMRGGMGNRRTGERSILLPP